MLWQTTTETRIKTEARTWVLTARVVKASKQAATRVVQWVTREAAAALWATRVVHPAAHNPVVWVAHKTQAAPRAVPIAGRAA